MGKQRRQRQKLHLSSPGTKKQEPEPSESESFTSFPFTITPDENIFKNINFESTSFKNPLWDDTKSVKSFKSVKSEKSGDKAMSKKEKIKLRRQYLMQKIDTVVQMKKEAKKRNKRKKNVVVGDMNPLLDALPSLDSLLKSRSEKPKPKVAKRKCIQKAHKRQKTMLQGIQIYKHILVNKKFKANPFATVSEHVQAVVEQEKRKV